jgi:cell division protein ZapA
VAHEIDDPGVKAVTIYGQTYHLRGGEDGTYLSRLASVVDRKMREVVETTGTADTLKVAILAALNIADDSLQARRGRAAPVDDGTDDRLARMITLLDDELGAQRDRPRRTGGG